MNRIAILFPGQGAQHVSMGKALFDAHAQARQAFELASAALNLDLRKLCFEGDLKELTRTSIAQPAILTVSYASYQVHAQSHDLAPCFMAGHSLGEYSALACSGALTFQDAVKVVRQRGLLMEQADPAGEGTMAAIKDCPPDRIVHACQESSREGSVVVAANFNTPNQTVISGHRPAVERAEALLRKQGASVTYLNVSAAFHSPRMAAAAKQFADVLATVPIKLPSVPVISNVDAKPYTSVEEIRAKLTEQLTAPVRWTNTMAYLTSQQVDVALDVGPKTVLRDLCKANTVMVAPFSLDVEEDRAALQQRLFGPYLKLVKRSLGVAVAVKNHNDNDDEYQAGVVKPYREIQAIYRDAVDNGRLVKQPDAKAALHMLRSVFLTKRVPTADARERMMQLLDETGLRDVFAHEVEQ